MSKLNYDCWVSFPSEMKEVIKKHAKELDMNVNKFCRNAIYSIIDLMDTREIKLIPMKQKNFIKISEEVNNGN